MDTQAIAWGDGTADTIRITCSGSVGTTVMTIAADPNRTLRQRQRTICLKSHGGTVLASLEITQKPGSRSFSTAYGNSYK